MLLTGGGGRADPDFPSFTALAYSLAARMASRSWLLLFSQAVLLARAASASAAAAAAAAAAALWPGLVFFGLPELAAATWKASSGRAWALLS